MRRPRFGSVLAAVAVATAGVIPLFAAPAGALNTCNAVGVAGQSFPATAGATLAQWKIDCTTNAGTKVDNAIFADSGNAYWHRGAARTATVTTTAASVNISFAAGAITTADIRRPIGGGCMTPQAFIQTVPTATTATLSKANAAAGCGAGQTATIEHTNNRVLLDASCTAAGVITSATGSFTAADIGRSVTGGPFKAGSRITAQTATTATVQLAAAGDANTLPCTAPDYLTIGSVRYTAPTTSTILWSADPMSVNLQNSTANGQAFTCVGSVLTETPGTIAMMGNFGADYIKLKVVVKGAAVTTASTVTAATATTLTLSAACPAGVAATVGQAAIGQPGGGAPKADQRAMGSLGASLNLSPALVVSADDCVNGQYEGFSLQAIWNNPLNATGTAFGFAAGTVIGAPVLVSTGQISFPTSVLTFAAYVRPQKTGGLTPILPAGSHFEYVLPSLPTTLASCNAAGIPTHASALSFGIVPSASPSPTPGAPGDPGTRAIGPQTGATNGQYILKLGAATVATGALPTCVIQAQTAVPAFPCGDG